MAYEITCSTLLKNIGKSDCTIVPGFDVAHILVPQGTEIATETLAKTLSTWTDKFKASVGSRFYPIVASVKQEPAQDEPVYETLSQGAEAYLYTNTSKDTFFISSDIITPQFNINMQALNNGVWACYVITSNGYIKGKSVDGTKFLPMNCSFRVLPQRKATDAEGPHLPYTVRLDSYEDWNLYGAAVKPTDFNPLTDFNGLLDVNLTIVGSPSSSEVIVDVKTDLNAIGVTGLAVGDFSFLKDSDGSTQTPDSMTESSTVEGRYTFAFTGLVDGTVDLVAASALTVEGYESTGTAAIDVP